MVYKYLALVGAFYVSFFLSSLSCTTIKELIADS